MAKSKSAPLPDSLKSGSAAIREVLDSGTVKPIDVVAKVKEKFGIDVTTGLIGAVKQKHLTKGKGKRGPKAGPKKRGGGDTGGNGLAVIESAATFVEVAGGLENAKRLLEAFARVQG